MAQKDEVLLRGIAEAEAPGDLVQDLVLISVCKLALP